MSRLFGYSRVPNCRVGLNKQAGCNFLEIQISEQDLISEQGNFTNLKLNIKIVKIAKLAKMNSFFNKRAGPNKSEQGGIF